MMFKGHRLTLLETTLDYHKHADSNFPVIVVLGFVAEHTRRGRDDDWIHQPVERSMRSLPVFHQEPLGSRHLGAVGLWFHLARKAQYRPETLFRLISMRRK